MYKFSAKPASLRIRRRSAGVASSCASRTLSCPAFTVRIRCARVAVILHYLQRGARFSETLLALCFVQRNDVTCAHVARGRIVVMYCIVSALTDVWVLRWQCFSELSVSRLVGVSLLRSLGRTIIGLLKRNQFSQLLVKLLFFFFIQVLCTQE